MSKLENSYGVIEGTLVYAKIAQSDKKYQSEEREYSIAVIVDEDAADEWDSKFKKQPAKKIRVGDFENKYKIPCPIEGVKNVFEIKLKRDATQDGVELDAKFRPKVFLDTQAGRIDITQSRLISNGSYGKVSYYIYSNDFGTFARLNNILIEEDNFKEYIPTVGAGPGSEFGEPKQITKVEPARDEVTKARKDKPIKKAPLVEEEDVSEDDDAPF